MATYTTNLNLKKPATSDKIRIADFNGNADILDSAIHDNDLLIANLKSDIGIVENTNTASHNISAGQYVIWKGELYTASDAISSGATLSNANMTAVSGGGLNALNSKIAYYTDVEVTLTSGDLINKDITGFSNRTILAVSFVYNDAFYYATLTDGRNITVLFRNNNQTISVIQQGGTRTTDRTVVIRVHYA